MKNKTILALDIDDCILPSNVNYFGMTNDALEMLEINLKRLVLIVEKYDMDIFIISAWGLSFRIDSGKLFYGRCEIDQQEPYEQDRKAIWRLLVKYLDGRVIGKTCGCRRTDIKKLIEDGHKVIALDDEDLSDLYPENNNYLFVEVRGFISGNVGFKIKNFM